MLFKNSNNRIYDLLSWMLSLGPVAKLDDLLIKGSKYSKEELFEASLVLKAFGQKFIVSQDNSIKILGHRGDRLGLLNYLKNDLYKISIFEHAIFKKSILQLQVYNKKEQNIYPHRIVYGDDDGYVIGEDFSTGQLVSIAFKDMLVITPILTKEYKPNFIKKDIDDYLLELRKLAECEERLVLKIVRDENLDLYPRYIYLHNPYLTMNSLGDKIWAATVEINQYLIEWLYSIKDYVEIITPQKVSALISSYKDQKDPQKKIS